MNDELKSCSKLLAGPADQAAHLFLQTQEGWGKLLIIV